MGQHIIRYKVVNILQNSIENNHFTYNASGHICDYGTGFEDSWKTIFNNLDDAKGQVNRLAKKYPPIPGKYRNWSVLEEEIKPIKRIPDIYEVTSLKIIYSTNIKLMEDN